MGAVGAGACHIIGSAVPADAGVPADRTSTDPRLAIARLLPNRAIPVAEGSGAGAAQRSGASKLHSPNPPLTPSPRTTKGGVPGVAVVGADVEADDPAQAEANIHSAAATAATVMQRRPSVMQSPSPCRTNSMLSRS